MAGVPDVEERRRLAGGVPGVLQLTTGLLVQLTKVKVIVFCVTALSAYVLPHTRSFRTLFAVGLFLSFTGPICNLAWIFAGVALRRVFADYRLAVNIAMAALLTFCAVGLAL